MYVHTCIDTPHVSVYVCCCHSTNRIEIILQPSFHIMCHRVSCLNRMPIKVLAIATGIERSGVCVKVWWTLERGGLGPAAQRGNAETAFRDTCIKGAQHPNPNAREVCTRRAALRAGRPLKLPRRFCPFAAYRPAVRPPHREKEHSG